MAKLKPRLSAARRARGGTKKATSATKATGSKKSSHKIKGQQIFGNRTAVKKLRSTLSLTSKTTNGKLPNK